MAFPFKKAKYGKYNITVVGGKRLVKDFSTKQKALDFKNKVYTGKGGWGLHTRITIPKKRKYQLSISLLGVKDKKKIKMI